METPSDVTWEDVLAYCKMGGIKVDRQWASDAFVITHPVSKTQYYVARECPEAAMEFLAGDGG